MKEYSSAPADPERTGPTRLRDDDPRTAGLADRDFFAQRPEQAFRLTTALPLELARCAGGALPAGTLPIRMVKRCRWIPLVAFFSVLPEEVPKLNGASNAELADIWRRIARRDLVAPADPAPRHQYSLHTGGNC